MTSLVNSTGLVEVLVSVCEIISVYAGSCTSFAFSVLGAKSSLVSRFFFETLFSKYWSAVTDKRKVSTFLHVKCFTCQTYVYLQADFEEFPWLSPSKLLEVLVAAQTL